MFQERQRGNQWLSMKMVNKSFRDSGTHELDLGQDSENDEKNQRGQLGGSLPVAPVNT